MSSAAYVIFAFADSLWLLFVSRVIQGLGGGTIGVVQAYVADITEGKDRAKALGWLSAVTSLGAVIGPALGSLLIDHPLIYVYKITSVNLVGTALDEDLSNGVMRIVRASVTLNDASCCSGVGVP